MGAHAITAHKSKPPSIAMQILQSRRGRLGEICYQRRWKTQLRLRFACSANRLRHGGRAPDDNDVTVDNPTVSRGYLAVKPPDRARQHGCDVLNTRAPARNTRTDTPHKLDP